MRNSIDGLERVELGAPQKMMDIVHRRLKEYLDLPLTKQEHIRNKLSTLGLTSYNIPPNTTHVVDLELRDEIMCRLNNLF